LLLFSNIYSGIKTSRTYSIPWNYIIFFMEISAFRSINNLSYLYSYNNTRWNIQYNTIHTLYRMCWDVHRSIVGHGRVVAGTWCRTINYLCHYNNIIYGTLITCNIYTMCAMYAHNTSGCVNNERRSIVGCSMAVVVFAALSLGNKCIL